MRSVCQTSTSVFLEEVSTGLWRHVLKLAFPNELARSMNPESASPSRDPLLLVRPGNSISPWKFWPSFLPKARPQKFTEPFSASTCVSREKSPEVTVSRVRIRKSNSASS